MSYLGRIAARVSGPSAAVAPGALARPAMRIESPIVAADQRLGLPQFANLMSFEAPASTAPADEPSDFGAVPAVAPIAERGFESSFDAPARHELRSTPAASAAWAGADAQTTAQLVEAESSRRIDANASRFDADVARPAVTSAPPRARSSAPELDPRAEPLSARPRQTELTLPVEPPSKVTSTNVARASLSETLLPEQRSVRPTPTLAVAMAELGSWLNSGSASVPPKLSTAAASSALSAQHGSESSATLEPRPAPLRPRPAEPQQLRAAPAPAMPTTAPAESGPVLRIGRIEVEVVPPPPSPAPSRFSPATAHRAPRATRSAAIQPPSRPFGWRQR